MIGFQIFVFDVGVNLGGCDTRMTEETLYGAEIGASCEQMGCIRMAECGDFCGNAAQLFNFLQSFPNTFTGKPFAVMI